MHVCVYTHSTHIYTCSRSVINIICYLLVKSDVIVQGVGRRSFIYPHKNKYINYDIFVAIINKILSSNILFFNKPQKRSELEAMSQ